jgi:DNA-binding MarR family transcriptional regulator
MPPEGGPSPFKHEQADDSPGFLLWKITALWQQRLAAVLAQLGITQTQYAILASLRWFHEQGEPPTQAHLVAHAHIEKMTLSKAIRKLEEAGLLQRDASPHDSRALHVRFTARGRKLVDKAVVAVEAADDAFFGTLGARDLVAYRSVARALIAANGERGGP